MALKPICVACQRFFRPEKNGFYFTEGMPNGGGRAKPGTSEPENWKPYKIWMGDLWKCHGCAATIIVGTPSQPVAEHYQAGFETRRAETGADKYQVNDC